MACDPVCECAARQGLCGVPLWALLAQLLSGCALLQPPAPPPPPMACERQDREIILLRQALADKDAEVHRLRAQQNVQATELEQTTGEVARAEIKLRRLATQADAASQLAEVEVALQSMRTEALPQRATAQLMQAQRILDAGSASFSQGDYGAAVELAAQSQEIIDMMASGRGKSAAAARGAIETQFQIPVTLRTRLDSNLRTHPGRTASVAGVLRQGTLLQAHAYRGDWLRVRTGDGRTGWVYGTLLEAPPADAE